MSLLRIILDLDGSLRGTLASYHTPVLDWVMIAASRVGRRGAIWLLLGLVTAVRRPWSAAGAWQLALAIGCAVLMADAVLKPAVGRLRPFEQDGAIRVIDTRVDTRSFPSGHAATAFAGAYALSRIWPEARLGLWLLAVLITYSRIYTGLHYPLDVVAGALVGVLSAVFVVAGSIWYDRSSARRLPPVPR